MVGFDQQIFRTTPPVNELVAKGAPLRAGRGRRWWRADRSACPTTAHEPDAPGARPAPGVRRSSTSSPAGAWPRSSSMAASSSRRRATAPSRGDRSRWSRSPAASATRTSRSTGATYALPPEPAAARHPRDGPRPTAGGCVGEAHDRDGSRSGLAVRGPRRPALRPRPGSPHLPARAPRRRADARLDRLAPVLPPASGGRRRRARAGPSTPARCYVRDAAGIATDATVEPAAGPWDDCFTDLRRPPVLRWPGFLELTIESDCPDWVVYTEPEDALCVEPQTAPPDAINTDPTIVLPGRPLIAEMTWRWRSLAG